jgi:hypothetical protein
MNNMKKFVFLLLIFFYIIAPRVLPVQAASSSSSSEGLIPIQACGYADAAPPGNKCCKADLKVEIKIPSSGNIALDIVASVVNSVLDSVVNKIFLPVINGVKDKVLKVNQPCFEGKASEDPTECLCLKANEKDLTSIEHLCEPIASSTERNQCKGCVYTGGIWTSVGCVSSNLDEFIQKTLLGWGIGLAGGVSMLCIIYSAFMMQTSGGNAEKIKKAQQLLTACITGLMFIIFSVLILKVIGVDILQIPGLS